MLADRVSFTKIWLIFAIVLLAVTSLVSAPVFALDTQAGENLLLGDDQTEHVLEVDVLGKTGAVLLDGDGQVKTAWSANDWDETCFLIFLPGDRLTWEDDLIPRFLTLDRISANDLAPIPSGYALLSTFDIRGYTSNDSETHLEFDGIELYLRTSSMQMPPSYRGLVTCYLDEAEGWTVVPESGESSDGILEIPLNKSGSYAILADLYASQLVNLEASSLSISSSVRDLWSPVTFATKTGELVIISTNVTNVGVDQETFEITLMIDGIEVDSMEVELQSGERMQIAFVLSGYDTGEYEVLLAGLSGSFVVSTDLNWFPVLVVLLVGGFVLGFGSMLGRTRQRPQEKGMGQEPPKENVVEEKVEAIDPVQQDRTPTDTMNAQVENQREMEIPEEFLNYQDASPEEGEVQVQLVNVVEPEPPEPQPEDSPLEESEVGEVLETGGDQVVAEPPERDEEEMMEIHQMLEGIRKDMDQLKEIAIASMAVPPERKVELDRSTQNSVEVGFLRENVLEVIENGGRTFDDLLEDFEVEDALLSKVLEDLIEEDLIEPVQKGNMVVFQRS